MNKLTLRIIFIIDYLLAFASGLYDIFFPNEIVDAFNYQILDLEQPISQPDELLSTALIVVALVLTLVCLFGLLLFKPWARHLYAFALLAAIPTYFINGLWLSSEPAQMMNDVSYMLSGAIIVFVYFSPASHYFSQSKQLGG
ncbi:hypothetical protein SOPP22_13845 [Shewanella sp. OPT22]|nr:hypothetical protein SOPP22_13845 [Shewanella sp. OPT22]